MTILTISQAQAYAHQAGFSGNYQVDLGGSPQQVIVAIAMAESGLNTAAVNTKDPNGGSYGILQINGIHFHGQTTKVCALNPLCAMQFGYSLYKAQGFQPWSTFTNGKYKQNMSAAGIGISSVAASSSTTVSQIFQKKGLVQWWSHPGGNSFGVNTEKGQDYSITPAGTPIGAIAGGTVVYVTTNGKSSCGTPDSVGYVVGMLAADGSLHHYQHLKSTTLVKKDTVSVGDIMGLSGGCGNSSYSADGRSCTCTDQFSTGPHIEVRYAPTGLTNSSNIWANAWVDPKTYFETVGNGTPSQLVLNGVGIQSNQNALLSTTFSSIAGVTAQITLAPPSSVESLLTALDELLGLVNPFNFTVSSSGLDPTANALNWLKTFGGNVLGDIIALTIRLVFIVGGIIIMYKIFTTIITRSAAKPEIVNQDLKQAVTTS
jgi:murein DD-endopeptidase MepM/ murein hydrolase activator NlpD